jgi:hypothetical protein
MYQTWFFGPVSPILELGLIPSSLIPSSSPTSHTGVGAWPGQAPTNQVSPSCPWTVRHSLSLWGRVGEGCSIGLVCRSYLYTGHVGPPQILTDSS